MFEKQFRKEYATISSQETVLLGDDAALAIAMKHWGLARKAYDDCLETDALNSFIDEMILVPDMDQDIAYAMYNTICEIRKKS